jgi:hypothetical protein
MKKLAIALIVALSGTIGMAQTQSTQYKHIANTWDAATPLTVCATGATAPISCVKDYIFTLTDPTAKSNTVTFAYPATSYTWGPGGFLYCGTWQANLAIEYFDDQGTAKTTTGNGTTATVACPFTVSPPSGLKAVPVS